MDRGIDRGGHDRNRPGGGCVGAARAPRDRRPIPRGTHRARRALRIANTRTERRRLGRVCRFLRRCQAWSERQPSAPSPVPRGPRASLLASRAIWGSPYRRSARSTVGPPLARGTRVDLDRCRPGGWGRRSGASTSNGGRGDGCLDRRGCGSRPSSPRAGEGGLRRRRSPRLARRAWRRGSRT